MIKPVTFQGQFHFNANLYALEVKSRFIDQNNAHGYYTGYGDELAAIVVGGNKIQVGTGAFVVCGRMSEITEREIVQPQIFDGFKGYVVARIETYHPADEDNCTIIAKIQTSWEALDRELEQNDVYAATADNINTAYELPIYSFEISGTQIVKLTRLIKPVCDYATIKTVVDDALSKANAALTEATASNSKSDNAVSVANGANAKSQSAVDTASGAVGLANAAKAAADKATSDVINLAAQIGEKQGTTVRRNGVALAEVGISDVAVSGSYNDLTDKPTFPDAPVTSVNGQTGAVTLGKEELGLSDVAVSGSYNDLTDKPTFPDAPVTSVNGQTGAVTLGKEELGLSDVAVSGSYNDLTDLPTIPSGGVTSVNGETGAVTITKTKIGLGHVIDARQIQMNTNITYGANLNDYFDTRLAYVQGNGSNACFNVPVSTSNPVGTNCQWNVFNFAFEDCDDNLTQLAISARSDCAMYIRNLTGGIWTSWKEVSVLPAPTSADNGKILIVQNGVYKLVTPQEIGIEIKSGLRNKLNGGTLATDGSNAGNQMGHYQYEYSGNLTNITCSAPASVTNDATISISPTGYFEICSINGHNGATSGSGSGNGIVTVTATFADGTTDTDTFHVNYSYTCLTGDSLITMADGAKKRIDSLYKGEKVLSFNPETMKLEADEITYSDSEENKTHTEYDVWTFSDGTVVKTVHRHRLYNVERQAMVNMDEWNIGEHAYSLDGGIVELICHETIKKEVRHYTIFTKNQNYFVNALLSGNKYTKEMSL